MYEQKEADRRERERETKKILLLKSRKERHSVTDRKTRAAVNCIEKLNWPLWV